MSAIQRAAGMVEEIIHTADSHSIDEIRGALRVVASILHARHPSRLDERDALIELVRVLREYGTFPPKILPALQAAERALTVEKT